MPEAAAPSLTPELAARLGAFARACKAAARAVSLYPPEHPAIIVALERLVSVATAAAARRPFAVSVVPSDLLIDGRACARPDPAIADLAMLLHDQMIGALTVHSGTDADSWRTFLALVAQSPFEVRSQGGITRAWTTAGGHGIEVVELDYAGLLEDREGGDEATWDAIIANCLRVDAVDLDEEALKALTEIARDPARLGDFVARMEEQASAATDSDGRATSLLRVLSGVVGHVSRTEPASLDQILGNMAAAATRLSPDVLLELLGTGRAAGSEHAQLVNEVTTRMTDPMLAKFVARSVNTERGCTARLAEAFSALAPGPARQRSIADLARQEVAGSALGGEAEFGQIWERVEEMLLSYSDRPYVSESYNVELSAARAHSLEIEHVPDDPPSRIAGWLTTVSDARVRSLDLQLLLDLLNVEPDPARWAEVVDLVLAQVEDLMLVGDLVGTRHLAEALSVWAADGRDAQRQAAAKQAAGRLIDGPLMMQLATHLNTCGDEDVEQARGICAAVGPGLIPRLAETLALEGRARSRQRLTELLKAFGEHGRQSIEQLKRSPSATVRRTAVQLLRTFGGPEAVTDLEEMLADPESSVQREVVRSLIGIGSTEAHALLKRTMAVEDNPARAAIVSELNTTRDEKATPLFCYIVRESECRGSLRDIYLKSLARLGAIGGRDALEALRDVLNRGNFWAPRRTRDVRHAAAAALASMKDGAGREVLEEAALNGAIGVRRAARKYLSGAA